MTPVGHFMCSSAVAGNVDVLNERETTFCFLYYAFFLVVFYILTLFFRPGPWAMHLHDNFGNAALLFFLIFWSRKETRKQYFVCLLIGGQILSAYTHAFDILTLKLIGYIPTGMWRPHNILHTPFAALIIPLIALPFVSLLFKNRNYKQLYFFLSLGYFLHIFADTITYNYQIYPLWPVSSFHFALIDFFQRPDAVSQWLGNPLYVFSKPSQENIDGFIVYRAEVMINILLAAFFYIKCISKRLLRQNV